MSLTENQIKSLIASDCRVRDDTEGMEVLNAAWELNTHTVVSVRRWKTQRDVCRYLVGKYREATDLSIGPDKFNMRQRFENALAMLAEAERQLQEAIGNTGPGSVSAQPGKTYMFKNTGERIV